MNAQKQRYIEQIRTNTAYPAYRSIIGLITLLGYLMAALIGFGALVGGLMMMADSFLAGFFILGTGLVYSAIIFVLAKFSKEASLIIADIGDSVTDANSRNQHG